MLMSIYDVCEGVINHYRHFGISHAWVKALDSRVLGDAGKELACQVNGSPPTSSDTVLSAFVQAEALPLLQGTNPFWVALVLKEATKVVPNSRHFERFSAANIKTTLRIIRRSFSVIFNLNKPLAQLSPKDYLEGQRHEIFLLSKDVTIVPNPVFYLNID